MKKNREQIVADARRQRDEIAQIFTDVASWNQNVRKADEAEIDPDPDGLLKELKEGLDRFLAAEDGRLIPPIWRPELVQRARDAHERTEFLTKARNMYAVARANFRTAAAPLILGDAELQQHADALERAIGEVSVDDALEGLRRFKAERAAERKE
jgi:hypothetical protein